MKAVVYDRLGAAREVLRVAEVDVPEPAPGEVRVRVRYSAVNPTDVKARAASPGKELPFPLVIPHQDGAGQIDAVGRDVDPARVGERVWLYFAAFQRPFGSAAEWVCVPAERAVALPAGIDLELAATLGIPAMTAHWALLGDGPIAGSTVLVAGGAGAVGHFAIELARWAGARVITTVSGPAKAALAEAAGADLVVNYRDPGAVEAIRAVAPDGVDRVIEVNLGANLALNRQVLAPRRTVVTYADDGPSPEVAVRPLMQLNASLQFLLIYGADQDTLRHAVADITTALVAGALTALPAHRFEVAETAEAHEAVESGVTGKVLVEFPAEPGQT